MNNKIALLGTTVVALTMLVAGCDGGTSIGDGGATPEVQTSIDVSEATMVTDAVKLSGGLVERSGGDFSFPEISDNNGTLSMTIPNGPPPEFAARRTIASGSGAVIGFGDPVILKYDMFSWSSGTLVESSSQFDIAHTVKGGVSDEYPIPEYLAKSLLGRSIGAKLQVVLPAGTEDLPPYLDQEDAYVLLVELL